MKMGPEAGGTPPEVQAAAEEEQRQREEEEQAAQAEPRPEITQPERRGLFRRVRERLFSRKAQTEEEAKKEAAEFENKVDQALDEGKIEEEKSLTPKEIHEMMLEPNRLPELMQKMNLEEFRRMKLAELHGSGTIGKTKQFFSGDSAIEYTGEQDIVKTNARKDLKRRATSVGLKTLPAAVAAVISGGAAIPAIAAMVGGAVGAGGTEAWEKIHGKGQGLREEIAKVLYYHWIELKDYANKYKEATSEEEKYKYLELITQKFNESSEKAKDLHCQFIDDRKRWELKKSLVTLAGSAAGFAWGALGFTHMLDLDKLSAVVKAGEKVSEVTAKTGLKHAEHGVRFLNGMMQFMTGESEKATSAAIQYGGHAWHTVGAGYQTQAAWEISKRGLAVLGANLVTGLSLGLFRRGEKEGFGEDYKRVTAEQERVKEVWGRRMPEMPESIKAERASGGGGGGATATEKGEGGGEGVPKIPEKFIKMAEEEGKSLPEEGKIWLYFVPGQGWAIYRIKKIHYESSDCPVELELLDMDFQNTNKIENVNLEDLLRRGQFRSEFVNDWLLTVKNGQKIRLKGGQALRNLNDQGRLIDVGEGQQQDFEFEKVTDRPHALLKKAGEENKRVSIFDLAYWGIGAVSESGETRREIVRSPKREEVWQKRAGVDLPASLSGLPDRVNIGTIEDGEIQLINPENNEPIEPPIYNIELFARIFERRRMAAGQQRQQREQRPQGGARNRERR